MRSVRTILFSAVLSLCACAADASEPPAAVDGRVLDAEDGALRASFVIDHPVKGRNALEIELFDGDSAPLVGAEIEVSPWMPAHGHGSKETAANERTRGVYETDDVVFSMAGRWELHVEAVTDEGTNHFVVPVDVAEN